MLFEINIPISDSRVKNLVEFEPIRLAAELHIDFPLIEYGDYGQTIVGRGEYKNGDHQALINRVRYACSLMAVDQCIVNLPDDGVTLIVNRKTTEAPIKEIGFITPIKTPMKKICFHKYLP